jgi:hypothetical protein
LRNGSFDVESLRTGGFDVDGIEGRGIVKSLVKHIESKAFAKEVFIDQASVHVSSHPGALARDIHRDYDVTSASAGPRVAPRADVMTTLTTDPSNPKPLIEPCFVCLDDIQISDFDNILMDNVPDP